MVSEGNSQNGQETSRIPTLNPSLLATTEPTGVKGSMCLPAVGTPRLVGPGHSVDTGS